MFSGRFQIWPKMHANGIASLPFILGCQLNSWSFSSDEIHFSAMKI